MRKLQDFNYQNKRIFLRVDLNVPVSENKILDDTRINKIIPTIQMKRVLLLLLILVVLRMSSIQRYH